MRGCGIQAGVQAMNSKLNKSIHYNVCIKSLHIKRLFVFISANQNEQRITIKRYQINGIDWVHIGVCV